MDETSAGGPAEPVRLLLQGREVACRAIIFDKDGTLVDPTGAQSRLTRLMALRAAAQASKGRLSGAACTVAHGGWSVEGAAAESADPTGKPADGAQAETASSVADEGAPESDEWSSGPELLPGVGPTLAIFRKLGLRLAVATGDQRWRAQADMEALGVSKDFAAIVSLDDVAHGKPAPDMVYVACERLGCSPAEVIVVGDSVADLMMGRAAGVAACIGVAGTFGASERLRALADAVLPTVAELPALVVSWKGQNTQPRS